MSLMTTLLPMALVIGTMNIANRFDLEDPSIQRIIIGMFLTAQTSIMLINYYIQRRVLSKADSTALAYSEPASWSSPNEKTVETTVQAYDMEKIKEALKQTFSVVALVLCLHMYGGYIRPLVIQSVLPLKNLYSSPLFQIHILGKPATGELQRPFKVASPFAGLAQPAVPVTEKELKAKKRKEDKKSIKAI